MELSALLKKVRSLVALAEHDSTPPGEAATAREMADALMLKYAIDEAELDASRPAAARAKPGKIDIEIGSGDMIGWITDLASYVARNSRCKIRHYTSSQGAVWSSTVYGYESDLRYFEVRYTVLRLHMLGVLRPKVDPSVSLEENAYRFHAAGYNWLEIAGFYGWVKDSTQDDDDQEMWYNASLGERKSNWTVGSSFKRAYFRACKERGETPQRIPAGGSESFRRSAAQGYVGRMSQRLREAARASEEAAGASGALALRVDDLDAFYREQNADLFRERPASPPPPPCPKCAKAKSGSCRDHSYRAYRPAPFSDAGYAAGSRHADSADLSDGSRVGTPGVREIG